MTRAKERLIFTSAEDYGGSRSRKISQFVLEALGLEPCEKEKKKASALEKIQHFAPQQESIKAKSNKGLGDILLTLSFYQIDDYLTCPLKYKFVNILRVPIMEHHTVIYGRAMHEAVSRFFQHKLLGEPMELYRLLDAFEASFDPQGFLDKSHQEERLRIGRQSLVKFFQAECQRDWRPKFIEKEFSFIFEKNKINGRFDWVDEQGEETTIMDFKTSEVKGQKEADKRAKESLQLGLYALAYKNIFGVLPAKGALYFLESGVVGSVIIKEGLLDEASEKIREVSCGIRQGEFGARPAYRACNYCAYGQICTQAVA
jgi:DNA helicase-2/ATP-dependent DNA helicase PcrA